MKEKNFHKVSEYPDIMVPNEQVIRLEDRYNWSTKFIKKKDVLEIGCGAGQGTNLILKFSKSYLGCDIDKNLIKIAKKNNPGSKFQLIDFQKNNNFKKKFDVIIIFEMIYYIQNLENFFKNISVLLRLNGCILLCNANKNVLGFTPGKYSNKYFDYKNLNQIAQNFGLKITDSYVGTKINMNFKNKLLSKIKSIATKYNLIPSTMEKKNFLKKIYYGGQFSKMPKAIKQKKIKSIFRVKNKYNSKNYKVLYFVLKKMNSSF